MPLPGNVGTGTVVGKFIDSSGANLDGTVTFTPSVPKLLDVTATPPTTIIPKAATATVTAGATSTVLMATNDADLNPVNWTYEVSFALTGVTVAPFSIAVPQGTTVDLTVVSPVPSSAGTAMVTGPGVPSGGTTGQALVKVSNADQDTAWGTVSGGAGGQPASAQLDAIAALSGTAYGRAFLTLANQAAFMGLVQAASETVQGKVELATNAETITGTSVTLATHPAGVAAAMATKAPTANPTFTGTVTVPDAAFAMAKVSGLASALSGKMTDGVPISLDELPPWSTVCNFYNTGTSAYPNRPTARTDIVVIWRGTPVPSVGGTGALTGVDVHWLA